MDHVEWGPSVRMAAIFFQRPNSQNVFRPARSAATSEPAAGSKQPHDQQQDDGADRRIEDLAHEAGAADDLPGEPACNQADEQNNEKALIGQLHQNSPSWCTRFLRAAAEPIDNCLM